MNKNMNKRFFAEFLALLSIKVRITSKEFFPFKDRPKFLSNLAKSESDQIVSGES